MTLLSFENVSRAVPNAPRPLVEGLTFALQTGECVALAGRSGAGKTTLLHLAAGLLRPTAGRVLFEGVDLARAPEAEVARLRAGRLGLVFQNNLSLPALAVWENAALPLRLAGIGAREARTRATELLERVGLGELVKAPTAALSGGQRRRLGLVRALLGNPRLLLADEPTADLDEATGADIEGLLFGWLRESGGAALIVTHDPELMRAAQRVLTLEAGRLVADTAVAATSAAAVLQP